LDFRGALSEGGAPQPFVEHSCIWTIGVPRVASAGPIPSANCANWRSDSRGGEIGTGIGPLARHWHYCCTRLGAPSF
jgi:hypothetical protein